jgi:hypothetical protein
MEAAARFAPMVQLLMMGMGGISKAFYQKYGKEALPIIAEAYRQGGVGWAQLMQQMSPAKGMLAYGESLKMTGSIMGMGMEIVELSNDKIHFKVSKCPFGIEGTSKELCEAMMNIDKSMISTILGQEGKIQVLKSVAVGDKMCEVIESK